MSQFFLWKRQLSIIHQPSATNEETPITVANLSESPFGDHPSIHCHNRVLYIAIKLLLRHWHSFWFLLNLGRAVQTLFQWEENYFKDRKYSGKCVFFSIFEWWNSQLCFFLHNCEFIQKLKSKHTSLKKIQTEKTKSCDSGFRIYFVTNKLWALATF